MILLNPGPVNVSERVRRALLEQDICHRESECSDLLAGIREKLIQAFVPGGESEYTAILLTGSGTAAVEAAVLSCVPQGKRVLVINNGVYGQRLSSIVSTQRLGAPVEFKVEWGKPPDPYKIGLAINQHPIIHSVVMVHHETTLGFINPIQEVAEVVDRQNRVFVVDSVSGLGGESFDIAGPHVYMVASAAQKCIQGFPGVGFVIVRKGFMDNVMKYPKRSWYLNLANYYQEQERGTIPFTPAVQVYYAFHEALKELLEEGVQNRIQRFRRYATMIRERMASWGIQAVIPAEYQSNSLTAFHLPENVSYPWLHDRLKERGYVIYAGQGQLESTIFRVANMGALTEKDIEGFLGAFQEILEQESITQ